MNNQFLLPLASPFLWRIISVLFHVCSCGKGFKQNGLKFRTAAFRDPFPSSGGMLRRHILNWVPERPASQLISKSTDYGHEDNISYGDKKITQTITDGDKHYSFKYCSVKFTIDFIVI
jgi:hypothetical protein